MCHRFIPLAAVFLLTACSLLEHPDTLGRSRSETMGEVIRNPKSDSEEAPDTAAHLYLAAVEYPKDYDWVRDTAHTSVDARLLLFRDGECTVSFPAGDAWRVSTDPDTHWILDGHLYTVFSDGAETWILRDGKPLHHYAGAEDIKGMLIRDGMLWTLAQKRSGSGFTLRCDATAVKDNAQGTLIGSLYADGEDLCFAFGLTVKAGNYTIRKYFLSSGDQEKEVSIPSDATAVFDIRRVGGITYATYRQGSIPLGPVLSSDGGSRSLAFNMSGFQSPDWCEIIPGGDAILVKGWYNCTNGSRRYILWDRSGMRWLYNTYIVIRDFYADGEGNIAAVGYDDRTGNTLLFLPPGGGISALYDLGKRYRFVSPRAALLYGGQLYVGLTGEGEDMLYVNGQGTPVAVNGPLTVLAYQ